MSGLPQSRNITISTSDPIPSVLLNALQDMVVGNKKPSNWRWDQVTLPNVLSVTGTNTMQAVGLVLGNGGSFTGLSMGTLEEGERITGFGIRFAGTGVAISMKFDLMLNTGTAQTSLGRLTLLNPANAYSTYTFTLAAPHIMLPGESLYLDSTAQVGLLNQVISSVGLQQDRL